MNGRLDLKHRSMELAESVAQLMSGEDPDLDDLAIAHLQAALDNDQLTDREAVRFLEWNQNFSTGPEGSEQSVLARMTALGWKEMETGGGCTGWTKPLGPDQEGWDWLMTEIGTAEAPTDPESLILLGLYNPEGESVTYLQGRFSDFLEGRWGLTDL